MPTVHDLLEEFRQEATSSRDLGDRFENLMVAFLKSDPMYQDLFSSVWTWNDFPKRGQAPDRGVDLVAEERATGDLWAIQCKFYDPNHTLDKPDIDSFFTESGKAIYTSNPILRELTQILLLNIINKGTRHCALNRFVVLR